MRAYRWYGGLAVLGIAGLFAAWLILGPRTALSVAFGSSVWIPVYSDEPGVPPSVSLALQAHPPFARPGRMAWHELAPGFEVSELPVIAAGQEVDRILLARVDPRRYRFVVRNAPAGDKTIDGWMRNLCAALVMNGSYYAHTGLPATPIVSDGRLLGPSNYQARQGAFVSSASATGIVDLEQNDWHKLLPGSDAAMVSYPLLLTPDGFGRAPKGTGWLANRSFLGQDTSGRIVFGTTKEAYFSLDRLSTFLKSAPLDLRYALNLDGGPVACQAVSLNGFKRRTCGRWEIQVRDGQAKMLPTWPFSAPSMPIAIAAYPRDGQRHSCDW